MLTKMRLFSGPGPGLFDDNFEESLEHLQLEERLRKTLYYGKLPSTTERPSLPMTEIAVHFIQDAAPKELGKLDMYIAANQSRRACISPCSLMLGMIYIERLKHKNPEYLQKVSSSELFLVAMMVASKFLYDEGTDEDVFNNEWAESGYFAVEELNLFERNFLNAIDWNLFVKKEDFWKLLNNIELKIAIKKSRERGFYTYTDSLLFCIDKQFIENMQDFLTHFAEIFLVCMVTYIASMLAIFASSAVLLSCQSISPVETKQTFPLHPLLSMRHHTESWTNYALRSCLEHLNHMPFCIKNFVFKLFMVTVETMELIISILVHLSRISTFRQHVFIDIHSKSNHSNLTSILTDFHTYKLRHSDKYDIYELHNESLSNGNYEPSIMYNQTFDFNEAYFKSSNVDKNSNDVMCTMKNNNENGRLYFEITEMAYIPDQDFPSFKSSLLLS